MNQEIKITGSFIWTFEDVKARQVALAQVGPRQRQLLFFFLIIISVAVMIVGKDVKAILQSPSDLFLTAVPLILVLTIYPVTQYSQNANLKKGFLQTPDSNKKIDITFTQNEIIMKAEGVYENKWLWNTIKEVRQDPKGFCFFLGEKTGFWIPIRAFQSQEDINSIIEFTKRLTPRFKVLG